MALVSGVSSTSTLNPDAPLYIPTAVRQVEDFSPEWWELINNATWFRDYWLSKQQCENGFFGEEQDGFGNDVADLLPDTIDIDADDDDDFLNVEAQFEEFIQSSETTQEALNAMPENVGLSKDAEALIKSLSKERGLRNPNEPTKRWEKAAKCVSPKCSPRIIQQPR